MRFWAAHTYVAYIREYRPVLLFLGSHIFLVELDEQRGKSTLVEIYSLFDSQERVVFVLAR